MNLIILLLVWFVPGFIAARLARRLMGDEVDSEDLPIFIALTLLGAAGLLIVAASLLVIHLRKLNFRIGPYLCKAYGIPIEKKEIKCSCGCNQTFERISADIWNSPL